MSALARRRRRPHLRRRHPGPPRPQRPSHRTHRRQPPAHPRQTIQNGLTRNPVRGKTLSANKRGAPGGIISLQGAASSRNPWAQSSRYRRAAPSEATRSCRSNQPTGKAIRPGGLPPACASATFMASRPSSRRSRRSSLTVREVLTEAAFQQYYVRSLRNVLDHLPRKAPTACRNCAGSTTAARSR